MSRTAPPPPAATAPVELETPDAAAATSAQQTHVRKDGARAWFVFVVIQVANFGLNCTFTMLTLAMPILAIEFSVPESVIVWVTLGPMIVTACLAPACGWLADTYGRKPLWLAGMAVNLLALTVSGFAPSAAVLIFGRVLQGVGQGADGPSGFALTMSGFSEGRRGRVIGIAGSLGAIAPSAGIVIGGLVIDAVGWRPMFIAPLPLVFISALVCAKLVKEPPPESDASGRKSAPKTFDSKGAATLFVATGTLLFAINQSTRLGWGSAPVLSCLGIAIVGSALLAVVERRAEAPIVDPAIFTDRIFVLVLIVTIFQGVCYMAVFIITPFLIVDLLKLSAFHASLIVVLR